MSITTAIRTPVTVAPASIPARASRQRARAIAQYLIKNGLDKKKIAVYVRGFVAAYARCIGVDPERVVSSYMRRLDGVQRSEPRRSQRSERSQRSQRGLLRWR